MNIFLVIDIGGTHIKFGVMENGVPRVLQPPLSTRSLINNDPIIELAKQIEHACQLLAINQNAIDAIVVTVPGILDNDLDTVHFSGNIPSLNGKRLATQLSAQVSLPVYLEHDVILLLQGEWLKGAGKNTNSLLGIFFGTGVGAAYLENGTPFRGNGFALEIGHIPFRGLGHSLNRPDFKPNCLENYVSGRALEAIAQRHNTRISDVFLACINNAELKKEIDCFIDDMAMATAVLMTLFSPQTLVMGGGICHMEAFPYEYFRQQLQFMTPVPITQTGATLEVRRAELGWPAVLYGATVRLGLHKSLHNGANAP